jgi:hypothetical protein
MKVKFRIDKVEDVFSYLDSGHRITAIVVKTSDPEMLNKTVGVTLRSDDKKDNKTLRKKLERDYEASFRYSKEETWFKTLVGRII